MNFSLYIARRYLFSRSKNNAINIITFIAGLGAFAGALALFIVLSGFAGLKAYSVQYTNEVDPDLKVLPVKGKTILLSPDKMKELQQTKGILELTRVIEERVLLNYENRNTPAFVKGVEENFNDITETDKSLVAGEWFKQEDKKVVIGSEISRKLSLGLSGYNDVLQLMVPKPGRGIVTDPREAFNTYNTLVIGVYDINEELNDKYVFMPLEAAQHLLGLQDGEVSAVELKLDKLAKESTVKQQVQALFDHTVEVKNRIELNDELYKMLNTENLAVYLIFTLVLIIALFNVGGAIVMAILDKRRDIETLFNIGGSVKKIRRIFLLQGALLTFVGGMLGLLAGILAVLLQQHYGMVMITANLPYPVLVKAENIALVFLTIMLLGLVASYVGSTRVSKVLQV